MFRVTPKSGARRRRARLSVTLCHLFESFRSFGADMSPNGAGSARRAEQSFGADGTRLECASCDRQSEQVADASPMRLETPTFMDGAVLRVFEPGSALSPLGQATVGS